MKRQVQKVFDHVELVYIGGCILHTLYEERDKLKTQNAEQQESTKNYIAELQKLGTKITNLEINITDGYKRSPRKDKERDK